MISFEQFQASYAQNKPQLLWTKMVSDLETPVSVFLKLAADEPYSLILESVEKNEFRGRYSLIGMRPDLIWRCRKDKVEINQNALDDPTGFEPLDETPMQSLDRLRQQVQMDLPDGFAPLSAGLFGYLSYDMIRQIEKLPDDNPDPIDTPDAMMFRPTIMVVFDHIKDEMVITTPIFPNQDVDAKVAYDAAQNRLAETKEKFTNALRHDVEAQQTNAATPSANMSEDDYKNMVARAKDYILQGDIFQTVLSQRFLYPFSAPPIELYRSLRRLNPSPFLFQINMNDFAIVGSSPEILVGVKDQRVTIRPIAGTRPRGKTPAEDKALAEDLLNDPKECAEHLMLLDLARNDVGRVAKIGSVEVTEHFIVEHYSHVMHIVSQVEGNLADDKSVLDALMAGFPAGTVSGAPKIRAMEIIDELEPVRRGIYGGAIGYFGADGSMTSCIALRTGVIKDGTLYVQAGAGIVADSDPDSEYMETVNKAKALITAAKAVC